MYSIWSEIPIHVIRNSKLTHDQRKGNGSSFNVGIWVPAIEHTSKTWNFLLKFIMVSNWETLNFTRCFIHQTNSNCLNFHGIKWLYDWSRNKNVIQDQSCHSNCETPCSIKVIELYCHSVYEKTLVAPMRSTICSKESCVTILT